MKTIFLPIFLFVCFVNTQAQNDTTWHVIESGILNSGISTSFEGFVAWLRKQSNK